MLTCARTHVRTHIHTCCSKARSCPTIQGGPPNPTCPDSVGMISVHNEKRLASRLLASLACGLCLSIRFRNQSAPLRASHLWQREAEQPRRPTQEKQPLQESRTASEGHSGFNGQQKRKRGAGAQGCGPAIKARGTRRALMGHSVMPGGIGARTKWAAKAPPCLRKGNAGRGTQGSRIAKSIGALATQSQQADPPAPTLARRRLHSSQGSPRPLPPHTGLARGPKPCTT